MVKLKKITTALVKALNSLSDFINNILTNENEKESKLLPLNESEKIRGKITEPAPQPREQQRKSINLEL